MTPIETLKKLNRRMKRWHAFRWLVGKRRWRLWWNEAADLALAIGESVMKEMGENHEKT